MVARTRIALMALVGVLAGTAPALATVQDRPTAIATSTGIGVSCTRCMAHVAMASVPLYKEVVLATRWFTAMASATTPSVDAAKVLGGKAFEVSIKKTSDER